MVRRMVAGVGRALITTGVLLLLFVAYQLWGTGIATAREQDRLENQVEQQLASQGLSLPELPSELSDPAGAPPTTTGAPLPDTTEPSPTVASPGDSTPPPTAPTATAAPPTTRELTSHARTKALPLKPGEAIGQIRIPKVSLTKYLVEGTAVEDLKRGPGHYAGTPLPGEPGNASIAGHRTTYGAPFFRLDELRPGDPIFVYTLRSARWFRYEVVATKVVSPKDSSVLAPTPGRNLLTLTTCHPRYSASQRMIITAQLVGEAVEADVQAVPQDPFATSTTVAPPPTSAPPATVAAAPTATTVPATTAAPTTAVPTTAVAAAPVTEPTGADVVESPTLDSRRAGQQFGFSWLRGPTSVWMQTLLWALVCAAIWVVTWWNVHRRRRILVRWTAYGVTFAVLFLPALYLCYENLARLLPENV